MSVDDLVLITTIVGVFTKAMKSLSLRGHKVPDDFLPVIAIVVGLVCSIAFAWIEDGAVIKDDVIVGIVGALSAMGLYSGYKTITKTEPPTIEVPAIPDPEPPVETPAPKPTPKPRKPRVPKVPVNEGGML